MGWAVFALVVATVLFMKFSPGRLLLVLSSAVLVGIFADGSFFDLFIGTWVIGIIVATVTLPIVLVPFGLGFFVGNGGISKIKDLF